MNTYRFYRNKCEKVLALVWINYTCCFHLAALDPTFTVSVGQLAESDATPYNCYLECLKQNIIEVDKPLTIGLAQGNICLCGRDPSKYDFEPQNYFKIAEVLSRNICYKIIYLINCHVKLLLMCKGQFTPNPSNIFCFQKRPYVPLTTVTVCVFQNCRTWFN